MLEEGNVLVIINYLLTDNYQKVSGQTNASLVTDILQSNST